MLQPDIRNAVRAVIVKDQQILVLRKQYPSGEVRYALPGGGQEPGETLEAALHRECREEIDASVTVEAIAWGSVAWCIGATAIVMRIRAALERRAHRQRGSE